MNKLSAGAKLDFTKDVLDKTTVPVGGVRSPLIDYTDFGNIKDQEYAFHHTYPIITETKIYMNMYLETLVMKRSVQLGKDCIEIQCAFRQYLAPTSYAMYEPTDDAKELGQPDRAYYTTYIKKGELVAIKIMDLSMNIAWAFLNSNGLMNESLNDAKKFYTDSKPIDSITAFGIELGRGKIQPRGRFP